MLSKNEIKFIRSLGQSKFREKLNQFIAEGDKVISEFLNEGFKPETIYQTNKSEASFDSDRVQKISGSELERISQLKSPQGSLAVFQKPEWNWPTYEDCRNELVLACDDIRDPGNLGTMIRIADWFGIPFILCSEKTAEAFNPKVVQATMGSLARVKVVRGDLKKWLQHLPESMPVIVTTLHGKLVSESSLPSHGVVVMGNEAAGVDPEIANLAKLNLKISGFGQAESLNVAVATGIILAAIRRAI